MGIAYRPLTEEEQVRCQRILASGNNVIMDLSSMEGMEATRAKRILYRRAILGYTVSLSPGELEKCKAVLPYQRCCVLAVEAIKQRVIEGFVAKATIIAKSKVAFARFHRNTEDNGNLLEDLQSEAMHGLIHSIYNYTDPKEKFMGFMTTVVNRWLNDYCTKFPTVTLPVEVSDLISTYYQIKHRHKDDEDGLPFDEIVRLIVADDLRESGVGITEFTINEALEARRDKFLMLRRALKKKINDVELIDLMPAPTYDDDEWGFLMHDIEQLHLTPLQRACLEAKLSGETLTKVQARFGCKRGELNKAVAEMRRQVSRVLQKA